MPRHSKVAPLLQNRSFCKMVFFYLRPPPSLRFLSFGSCSYQKVCDSYQANVETNLSIQLIERLFPPIRLTAFASQRSDTSPQILLEASQTPSGRMAHSAPLRPTNFRNDFVSPMLSIINGFPKRGNGALTLLSACSIRVTNYVSPTVEELKWISQRSISP